ncbi:MAG: aldo/keto reductase [Anaerolineae bacterium]|nr:aldo/keto reductase [Anaerolineae bacterium]NUQ06443.1 aldo/keto reductase [Anaerolineae bacterium]
MEYRLLGGSGLKVPALCFGTATFGGRGDFFSRWGTTQVEEAARMIDLLLDAGVNFVDTANVYSAGLSEEVLGAALGSRRHQVIISTKATYDMSSDPNEVGSSRYHLIRACEDSLRRLKTEYIDIYTMHTFDAQTPVEETLRALDDLVGSGKVRYIACSNFSGWHLMKSLAVSDRYGWARYAAHQAFYSLVGRDYEWELMPLALDQRVGTLVWSPLAGGRLSGKYRRSQPMPADTRIALGAGEGPISEAYLYQVVDAMDEITAETGRSHAQIALNWLLRRPTVSSVIIGARSEAQLRDNLGAVGWALTPEQVAKLDAASETAPAYPYWHQRGFQRNPTAVPYYKNWD